MGLLVLNVDHLPTHLLGPYGNTSVPTPTLNRWAAAGIVVDAAFKSGWRDQPLPCRPPDAVSPLGPATSSPVDLRFSPTTGGHPNWRSNDSDTPANSASAAVIRIPTPVSHQIAQDWESTGTCRYLEQVVDRLATHGLHPHQRIWLDLPLFSGPWDAPLQWRSFLADDEASEIYTQLQPPQLQRTGRGISGFDELEGFEPDYRLACEHAAGAMVILLDHACEWLQACLMNIQNAQPLAILLTAESGLSLGEHFGIGTFPTELWAEETHLPVLLHTDYPDQFPARVAGVQDQSHIVRFWWNRFAPKNATPNDLNHPQTYDRLVNQSLQEFRSLNYSMFSSQNRQAVLSVSANNVNCRTATWSFFWPIDNHPQLFVRPDDRSEQNDVATRCRNVVASFLWFLPDIAHALGHNPSQLPPMQNKNWLRACESLAADGLNPTNLPWDERLRQVSEERFTPLEHLPTILWESQD